MDLLKIHRALERLPMGCWPDRDHPASWSVTDYLLANILDELRMLQYVVVKVNGGRAERPKPSYRPGTGPGRRSPSRTAPRGENTKKTNGWGDLARMLAAEGLVTDGPI